MPSPKRKPAIKQVSGPGAPSEQARLHQAEMLLDVSRKVAAIETLDEVLETLVEITTRGHCQTNQAGPEEPAIKAYQAAS